MTGNNFYKRQHDGLKTTTPGPTATDTNQQSELSAKE